MQPLPTVFRHHLVKQLRVFVEKRHNKRFHKRLAPLMPITQNEVLRMDQIKLWFLLCYAIFDWTEHEIQGNFCQHQVIQLELSYDLPCCCH